MPKMTAKASARRTPATASKKARSSKPGAARSKKAPRASAGSKSSSVRTANGARKSNAARKANGSRKANGARETNGAPENKGAQPIPKGYGPVTAQLVVSPCAEAIEFYERAFGAKELLRMAGPDGLLVHAEIEVGGAVIMLSDQVEMPGPVRKTPKSAGATTGGVMLYVQDVDAAFQRAVEAGAQATLPPKDQFWGDRFGQVEDPYGHVWSMATHLRDVTPEEMQAALVQMHAAEA